ncbi:MAG: transcription termination/antitermination protein NusG [Patescibacteria group bacterium]
MDSDQTSSNKINPINDASANDPADKIELDPAASQTSQWYVINTYSGYEDHVRQALMQRIESMDMSERIFDVIVPKEKKVEIKNGKKKIVEKKIFPGYVLVQMMLDEDSWYVVRNTPSVTGFIGFGSKPTPLSDDEIKNIQKRMGIQEPEYKIDFNIGDGVKIIDGPFKDFDGVISEIDKIRGKIKVLVSMFGRETPVELDALQIRKI